MNYIQPTKLDIPAVGELYLARERKKATWEELQSLRRKLRAEPLNGNRLGLRVAILGATEFHFLAMQREREALEVLERRANELGLTTIKTT